MYCVYELQLLLGSFVLLEFKALYGSSHIKEKFTRNDITCKLLPPEDTFIHVKMYESKNVKYYNGGELPFRDRNMYTVYKKTKIKTVHDGCISRNYHRIFFMHINTLLPVCTGTFLVCDSLPGVYVKPKIYSVRV